MDDSGRMKFLREIAPDLRADQRVFLLEIAKSYEKRSIALNRIANGAGRNLTPNAQELGVGEMGRIAEEALGS